MIYIIRIYQVLFLYLLLDRAKLTIIYGYGDVSMLLAYCFFVVLYLLFDLKDNLWFGITSLASLSIYQAIPYFIYSSSSYEGTVTGQLILLALVAGFYGPAFGLVFFKIRRNKN
ncbi:hypothetical protein CWB72_02110 [Pseudoalteromonas phenolica]|nr:hypothetical protein CWB72_02110 [Pseudoalteromonas phenolica]